MTLGIDAYEQGSAPTREDALELLARRLHWKMEQFEPTEDDLWEALSERQRDFYRSRVRALFQEQRLARIAVG
jgi:hypothetical protein